MYEPAAPAVVSRAERPPTLTVGTVVWLASELMFFGGLFAAYFTLRAQNGPWPPHGVELDTLYSAIFTVVLVASSGTVHLATQAMARGQRKRMQRWLLVTFLMGFAFDVNQAREFLSANFHISSNVYGSIYYLLVGFHGLHVLAGLVMLLVAMTFGSSPGPLDRRAPAIESISYYWHFVDVVWIAVFTTIFIIR